MKSSKGVKFQVKFLVAKTFFKSLIKSGGKLAIGVFEIAAIVIAGIAIFVGIFAWRLQKAPIQVSFLKPVIQEVLQENIKDIHVEFETVGLAWAGLNRPLNVKISSVIIKNPRGLKIGGVQEIDMSVSIRALLFGEFRPTYLAVYSPYLFLSRSQSGELSLDFYSDDKEKIVGPTRHQDQNLAGSQLDEALKALSSNTMNNDGFLAYLNEFSVKNARLVFTDFKWAQMWRLPDIDVNLQKGLNGFQGEFNATALTKDGEVTIQSDIKHNRIIQSGTQDESEENTGETFIQASIEGLTSEELVRRFKQLSFLKGANAEVKADVKVALHNGYDLSYLNFNFSVGEGVLPPNPWLKNETAIKGIIFEGRYDDMTNTAAIQKGVINLGDTEISVDGNIDLSKEQDNMIATAKVDRLNAAEIKMLWPEEIAGDAREWVFEHIHNGTINDVNTQVTGHLSATDDALDFSLSGVKGDYKFDGLELTYLPHFPAVNQLTGNADFTLNEMNFYAKNPVTNDMRVEDAHVRIYDLDGTNGVEKITIALKGLSGNAPKLAEILSKEPIAVIQKIDKKPADFSGDVTGNLSLSFPLLMDLPIEKVHYEASGHLKKASLKDVYKGHDLTSADVIFDVNPTRFTVEGTGQYLNTDLKKLSVLIPIENADGKDMELSFDASAHADIFPKIDLNVLSEMISGVADVNFRYTDFDKKDDIIDVTFDATKATVKYSNYITLEKEAGQKANGKARVIIGSGNVLKKIQDLSFVTADKKTNVKGEIIFDENQTVTHANFDQIKSENNDVSLQLKQESEGFLSLSIKGKKLDMSDFFDDESDDKNNLDDKDELGQHYAIGVKVDELITAQELSFNNVAAYLEVDKNAKLDRIEFDGVMPQGSVKIRYMPDAQTGLKKLRIQSDNAGDALIRFGISEELKGGRMYVKADATEENPSIISGLFLIKDMDVIKAPTLARLLNALSFSGMADFLSGNRTLKLDRIAGRIDWDQTRKKDVIKIRKGKISSSSLGLTFEGNYLPDDKVVDFGGTIVPVSDINKFISSIPIVGDILTLGSTDAIFAATYTVRGKEGDSDISVNPLSALAPGFLRGLFFESDFDEKDLNE